RDDWNNFGPRVGFAYDVSGSGKTVIRGAFGTFFERIQGNDSYNSGPNVPFSANPTLNTVSFDNPQLNITDGTTLSGGFPVVASGITGLSRSYPAPISYQYNFGVQQALNSRTIVSLNYVGNQQRNQSDFREINIPAQSQLATLVANPGNLNTVRPFKGFG